VDTPIPHSNARHPCVLHIQRPIRALPGISGERLQTVRLHKPVQERAVVWRIPLHLHWDTNGERLQTARLHRPAQERAAVCKTHLHWDTNGERLQTARLHRPVRERAVERRIRLHLRWGTLLIWQLTVSSVSGTADTPIPRSNAATAWEDVPHTPRQAPVQADTTAPALHRPAQLHKFVQERPVPHKSYRRWATLPTLQQTVSSVSGTVDSTILHSNATTIREDVLSIRHLSYVSTETILISALFLLVIWEVDSSVSTVTLLQPAQLHRVIQRRPVRMEAIRQPVHHVIPVHTRTREKTIVQNATTVRQRLPYQEAARKLIPAMRVSHFNPHDCWEMLTEKTV